MYTYTTTTKHIKYYKSLKNSQYTEEYWFYDMVVEKMIEVHKKWKFLDENFYEVSSETSYWRNKKD